jgi:hypothetical protein
MCSWEAVSSSSVNSAGRRAARVLDLLQGEFLLLCLVGPAIGKTRALCKSIEEKALEIPCRYLQEGRGSHERPWVVL